MEAAETYEHAGVTVEIHYDDDPQSCNPREGDQLGVMHISYPGYELGDEQLPREGLPEIDCPVCGERELEGPVNEVRGLPEWPECARCENFHQVEPTVEEWLASEKAIAAMPLFIYEHSGMTIKASSFVWLEQESLRREDTRSRMRFMGDDAGWDTSFVGFITCTRERCEELGVEIERENLERQLKAEVAEYALYLEGQCFGYTINAGPFHDSCWGFLGIEESGIKDQANEAAEQIAEQIKTEKREQADWAARGVVTV